jgi:DNA-binding transcriptional ArsR family regulator
MSAYHQAMPAHHPSRDAIRIEDVLSALGSPLRIGVVRDLAAGGEHRCSDLVQGVAKSTLTHHWRVLRESGVTRERRDGRELLLELRREDLDARFPGLLDAILAGTAGDPPR